MIKQIDIQGFRGVKSGGIDGLSPLSILVGPNNCGKTTVLEALFAIGCGSNGAEIASMLSRRGGTSPDALRHIVKQGSTEAMLTATDDAGRTLVTRLSVGGTRDIEPTRIALEQGLRDPMEKLRVHWQKATNDLGFINGVSQTFVDSSDRAPVVVITQGPADQPYHSRSVDLLALRKGSQLEEAFSEIQRSGGGRLNKVVAALQTSMPGLTNLQILKSANSGDFLLHTTCGDDPPVPAFLAGDGLKRFLAIAAEAVSAVEPACVLLEEPESFQHPRYLAEMVRLLLESASPSHQIVLATHSIELIDLLLRERPGEQTFPTVHRLRLSGGELRATTLSRAAALSARDELLQDLRS